MLPPPGYCKVGDKRVCKLNRSIYGLKQTSRQWFTKLSESLSTIAFVQSKADSSLFTKKSGSCFTVILCYVDDMIIIGNSMSEIQLVKDHLHKQFTIKDLGTLKYILGI